MWKGGTNLCHSRYQFSAVYKTRAEIIDNARCCSTNSRLMVTALENSSVRAILSESTIPNDPAAHMHLWDVSTHPTFGSLRFPFPV
jgi:hypothetical protein